MELARIRHYYLYELLCEQTMNNRMIYLTLIAVNFNHRFRWVICACVCMCMHQSLCMCMCMCVCVCVWISHNVCTCVCLYVCVYMKPVINSIYTTINILLDFRLCLLKSVCVRRCKKKCFQFRFECREWFYNLNWIGWLSQIRLDMK